MYTPKLDKLFDANVVTYTDAESRVYGDLAVNIYITYAKAPATCNLTADGKEVSCV